MEKVQFDFSSNIGGICRMFAIPPSSFVRIFRNHKKGLTYLYVIRRSDIIDIYFTEDTGDFIEDEKLTAAGPAYKIEIKGIVPKSHLLNQKQLTCLTHGRWLVLFQDNNENIRLAGNEETLLRFERRDTSGTITTRNQIEFSFRGVQSEPCCFIELDDPDNI